MSKKFDVLRQMVGKETAVDLSYFDRRGQFVGEGVMHGIFPMNDDFRIKIMSVVDCVITCRDAKPHGLPGLDDYSPMKRWDGYILVSVCGELYLVTPG